MRAAGGAARNTQVQRVETPRAWSSHRRVTGEGLVREGRGLTFGLGHRGLLVDLVRAVPCYGGNRGQRA